VFYELLTGELPFKGDHEAAVLYGIANNDPPMLRTYLDDIPDGLQRVIGKALAKDVDDRYPSAGELMGDLKEFREQTGGGSRGRAGLRQRRRGRLVAVIAGVTIVVALAVVFWPRLPTRHSDVDRLPADQHALAIVDFQDLATPDDFTISAGMTELVNTGLIEASPIRVVSSEYLHELRRKLFGSRRGPIEEDQALEVARKSGATLLLAGRMGSLGDERFVTWRLVDTRSGESLSARRIGGMKLTGLADNIIAAVLPAIASACGVEPAAGPMPIDQITPASPEAYKHYVAGLLATERGQGAKAADLFRSAVRLDSTFALGYFRLGRVQSGPIGSVRDHVAAKENIVRAWEFRSRLGLRDRMRLEAYRYRLDREARRMIEAYREILGRWPDDRETLADLAEQLFGYWDHRGAAEVYDRFLSVYPEGGTPAVHSAALRFTGRLSEALEAARRTVARDRANPNAWDELGLSFLALGTPDSAEVAFRTAIGLDPEDPGWRTSLALCDYARGKTAKAIEICLEVLQEADLLPRDRTYCLLDLADLYLDTGQYQDALAAAKMSKNRLRNGDLLLAMGRSADALEIAEAFADGQTFDGAGDVQASFQQLILRTKALVMMGDLDGARAGVDALYSLEDRFWGWARYSAWQVEVEVALAENQPDVALAALDKMSQQGVYIGWRLHILHRDALARAHSIAGDLDKAVEVHQEMLRLYGGHALSWYELGKLYEEMKRPDEAVETFTKFLEMWSEADEGLPELVDARARLAALTDKTP
jgi:tetratricopeptide (TPR) repeat protein